MKFSIGKKASWIRDIILPRQNSKVHVLWLLCFPTINPTPSSTHPPTYTLLPAKPVQLHLRANYTRIYTYTRTDAYMISLSLSLVISQLFSIHFSLSHYSSFHPPSYPPRLSPEILSTTTAAPRNCSLWISNRMVKAGKWFRGLLGLKKPECPANPNQNPTTKPPKRRWSFVKSNREKDSLDKSQHGASKARLDGTGNANDPSKHAVAVAAATAKVAEAAIAAAQAAAAVVQLTNSGRSTCGVGVPAAGGVAAAWCGSTVNSTARINRNGGGYGIREELAAVKIQSHFRAYLVTSYPYTSHN